MYDPVVPCWRGEAGTTYQKWRFDTGANPSAPEAWVNPYSPPSPSGTITLGNSEGAWWDSSPGYGTNRGIWDLSSAGTIALTIPNRSDAHLGAYKYVWVQVGQFIGATIYQNYAAVSIPGATYVGGQRLYTGYTSPFAGACMVDQTVWLVPTVPSSETITITANPTTGGAIDEVIVDTRCIDPLDPISPAGIHVVGTQSECSGLEFAAKGSYVWDIANATTGAGVGWDLLDVTGMLNVTATNKVDGVLDNGNKFTIKLVSPASGTASFTDSASNSWVIARASVSVDQFNASKFILDTADFWIAGTSLTKPTGTFSLALVDKALVLVYSPTPGLCTGHTVASFYIAGSGGSSCAVMTFTNSSGLASVQALVAINSIIQGKSWPGMNDDTNSVGSAIFAVGLNTKTDLAGSPQKVVLWSTKGTNGPATVNVIAIDTCGLGKSFDPVMTDMVVGAGGVVRQHFKGLLAAERYLQVFNGTPGLRRLEINLNGHLFVLDPLADGANVAGDLAAGMVEGDQNEVTLTGYGVAGARATVLITDMPGANSVTLAERAELAITPADGRVILSWPEHMTGWQLQTAGTPEATVWDGVLEAPVVEAGRWTVALPTSSTARFFRLAEAASGATASSGPPATGASLLNKVDTNSSKLIRRTYEGINW